LELATAGRFRFPQLRTSRILRKSSSRLVALESLHPAGFPDSSLAFPRDRLGACDRRSLSLPTASDDFLDFLKIFESMSRTGNATPRRTVRLLAGLPPCRPATDLELATAGRFRFPQLRISRVLRKSSRRLSHWTSCTPLDSPTPRWPPPLIAPRPIWSLRPPVAFASHSFR
jgi:hypothetical protein